MRRIKQAVCLLLCFVMVVGLLPLTAFAAGTGSVRGEGNLVGGKVYTLNTDGEIDTSKTYLIVNTGSNTTSGHALTNNSGSAGDTTVTVSGGKITVADDTNIAWTFSGTTSGTVKNGNYYVYLGSNSTLSTSTRTLNINHQGNGAYRIQRSGNGTYYLVYSTSYYSSGWTRSSNASNVYLYEYTSSSDGAAVVFTLTPGSVTLNPQGTEALVGTVTVGGETVDLSDCTITWASSDATKATVSNGTITAVADGTANITATLSAVNGTAMKENIVLTVPVTVQSKKLDSSFTPVLTGNDPITIAQGETPDFSGIQLEVKYEGDEETTIITVENGLVIGEYDNTTIGSNYLPISFGGTQYGTVRLTVEGNPYAGKDEATDYPEYPADGAVRIDKTATEVDFENTGVVKVELDVAGVSVRNAVDAVLTIDISNSMAWATGSTTDNFTANKLTEVMAAVKTFAEILLADNDDGTPTSNTVTIVTFAGYDKDHSPNTGYIDSVRTLVTKTNNLDVITAIAEKTKFTSKPSDYQIQVAYIPEGEDQNTVANIETESGNNRGDTNYDYAFWQTNQAIINGSLGGENREVHVLFMTDGCASNYNGVYYRTSNVGYYYKPGTETAYTASTTYTNGTDWTNYIKNTLIPNGNGNTYANTLYENIDGMYAVGFDMAHGSFAGIGTWNTSTDWEDVFNDIVSKSVIDEEGNGLIPVTAASDTDTLNAFYESLGRALRYAGTQAQVTDIVDSDFDLQLTQTTGTESATTHGTLEKAPTIEIKAYDLYTKDETTDAALIGTRQKDEDGEYVFDTIETITFSDDGSEAYSNLKSGNIMTTADDGTVTIEAFYFTYTKTSESVETFKWNIGNITDKEITLSYYAYLNGSMEGERAKGLYYTNEEATLEYIDINDKHATKVFPVPAVAWGGASTAYEFYLVNEAGQPCDREGNVIPFANRIIITGPYYEELYLNQEDEEKAKEIIAAYVLPAGYTLYDETAKYTVITASGTKEGSLTISTPASGKAQTTIVVSATTPSYIQSRVAFGVNYNDIPTEADFELTPDTVVIDYGKNIVINIANGNDDLEDGYTAKLVGFSKYYDTVDRKTKFSATSATDDYKAAYGTFHIENNGADGSESTVRYIPTAIVNDVEMIFCVIEMYNATSHDTYYMVDWLTVIPATSVYYETDFADGVFTNVGDWTVEGTPVDDVQDDGTIGQGQTYGYDSTYADDRGLSNESSWYVRGQGYEDNTPKTYTTFSFQGTGFDLISRTGDAQGLIKVEVFSDEKMTALVKTVSVLNKSESNLELYQIPVVSINDLTFGTYHVRVSVDQAFTSTIPGLESLNRGNDFYFDAIRIFDPVQSYVANSAYYRDGEWNRQQAEVRGLLLGTEEYANMEATETGMLFIDKTQSDVEVADYAAIGPNNETYLSRGQAIAFQVTLSSMPGSFDIGAKSIDGGNAKLLVTVIGRSTFTFEADIASATAQNYNVLTGDANRSVLYNGGNGATVVITNEGESVLSITDIKVASGSYVAPTAASAASVMSLEDSEICTAAFTVDASTFALARNVLTAVETPDVEVPEVTEPETTEPETEPETEVTEPETEPAPAYQIFSVSADTKGGIFSRKTQFTVVTTQDVADLKIAQMFWFVNYASLTYEDLDNGTRVWTMKMPTIAIGAYTITAYGADGTRGDSASVISLGL